LNKEVFWSRWGELNPRPADYESAALPLSYTGAAKNMDMEQREANIRIIDSNVFLK
jgi:hypothetical protein